MFTNTTFWMILAAAVLAMVGFAFLEWRRVNRRHLPARLAATVCAVAALALLGLRPTWRHAPPPAGGHRAALWTSLDSPAALAVPADIDAPHRFALPDATRLDPGAAPVPDAAFLRRRHPEIGTVRILGDGLDPLELATLRGLRVEFDSSNPTPGRQGVRFLRCPRELTLGDPLIVQGSLGSPADAPLTLAAPDGTTVNAAMSPTDATRFTFQTPSPSSTGHFLWHLRAPATATRLAMDLPLGVAVVPPNLPRVLVLESAPRFDTAALRRWFESAGGTLVARTEIGQTRYRFGSSAATPPPPFTTLDAPLFAGYDVVLADARSLLALPPTERDALLAAIADTGLGVLLLPDDAPTPAQASALFPWTLAPLTTDTPGNDRPARLQWPGQAAATDLPIPTAPFEIARGPGQRPLLGDRQGHTLAAATAHGRGQIALTLVRDTTRWQRENDAAAFAAYWSFLFSKLARSADPAMAGHWSLVDGDAGPVFVDHPVELEWSGPATPPGPAIATTATTDQTTLALASNPAAPGRWRGTFWPRRPGWHHVALASGEPGFDFFVSTVGTWPTLAAERRRAATARFAAASVTSALPPAAPAERQEFPPGWLAAMFFLSAGYLWTERRFT